MLRGGLARLHWLLTTQMGIEPLRPIRALRALPRYLADRRRFRRGYSGMMTWMPCLHDRGKEGGTTRSDYFWQDLLVAGAVFAAQPRRHVDIGSRVDGFVAHVASFREIEVFDIRPITTEVPGITFNQADLMDGAGLCAFPDGYCDSLSCLHAIEHFGLGRYGDPIEPEGHLRGIENMARLLEAGGTFYLSTPIGRERIEFNAHRVFDPRQLVELASRSGLLLRRVTVIDGNGKIRTVSTSPVELDALAEDLYNLGLFEFTKQ